MSTQGHHLNKLGSTGVLNAAYQISTSLAFWFQRRRFWKFASIYGHGGYLGHVKWTISTRFHSSIPWRLHMKCGFNRPSVSWGKGVWKCWIWVTLDKGQWMILTFDVHKSSCTNLVNCIYKFCYHRLKQFLKNPLFYLFPIQKHKGPNLTLP